MSHTKNILKEFGTIKTGSLSVSNSVDLVIGNTSAINKKVTPAPTVLADSNATITVAQLKSGLLTITPTASRTLTLPTAALSAAFLTTIGDSLEFTVINSGADTFHVILAPGASGTAVGFMTVRDSDATTASDTGSGRFLVRQTNVTSGAEAYTIYRLA